jgi:pimeloyl-ACP methyl ester carboxylesterase
VDNAARAWQRVLAIFLPVTAVLYISAEALSPKGTDQVISTTATALKVLPIAARHPAQLYVAGSLALLGFGGLAVSYAAIAALVAQRPGLVLVGPFVRNPRTSAMRRLLLRVGMAPPWAAISWKSYLPKLYAGRRPADFGEYRALVVMGEQDPDFRDPRAEADWIARALCVHVVMVPEAGHYPQSQRPGITTGAVLRFLESGNGRA